MRLSTITEFLRLESAAGLLLLAAAALALIAANSPASGLYDTVLSTRLAVSVNGAGIDKPLLLWINDGLMAVFFLLIGLELKRELLEGELATLRKAALPAIAAIGGLAVPAIVYAAINWGAPDALRGWAIPAATDIAFALGIMALLGSRVPASLKIFLVALAILDDLAAIVIIALFYTENLSLLSLALAGVGIAGLVALNASGVSNRAAYVIVGVFLWTCVLKSGVHATLAGVAVALAIPLRSKGSHSPLRRMEHALHPWVSYAILPLFAFANAGVSLADVTLATLVEPVPLGIAAGLFFGKQIGVMAAAWVALKSGYAALPEGVNWAQFYGAALLTGIGFTMSLFIGTLAFDSPEMGASVRIGVLTGSIASALAGAGVLWLASRPVAHPAPA